MLFYPSHRKVANTLTKSLMYDCEPQRCMEHSLLEVIQEDIQADLRGAPGQWDVDTKPSFTLKGVIVESEPHTDDDEPGTDSGWDKSRYHTVVST